MAQKKEKTEVRYVICKDRVLEYRLTRKAVKNINLRVKPDGTIHVSANSGVPKAYVDDVVRQKQDFLVRALEQYAKKQALAPQIDREAHKKQLLQKYPKEYQQQVFMEMCNETYAVFRKHGYRVPHPELKIRYMTARWGSCQPQRGIITLNSQLIEKPRRCIEYVVLHEFAHFIHPNHSREFYILVESLMPDWKERKAELNG